MFTKVIFDFDGVLVDSEAINIEAITLSFNDLAMPLTAEETSMIPGRSSQDIVPKLLRVRNISPERDSAAIELVRGHYDELWESMIELMPNTAGVLLELANVEVTLAIGTTNRRAVIERFFKRYNLKNFFPHVVTGEMVSKKKPDPEVYLLVADKLGVPKGQILVVEDTEVGVLAAKAAGLSCAAIPNRYSATHDFSTADFVLSSLQDVLPLCGA